MTVLTRQIVDGFALHDITIGNDEGGNNVFAFAVPATGEIKLQVEEAHRSDFDPIMSRIRAAMQPCATVPLTAPEARRLSAALAEAADLIEAGPGTNVVTFGKSQRQPSR